MSGSAEDSVGAAAGDGGGGGSGTAPAPAEANGRLVVISGPSGVGKSTVTRLMLQRMGEALRFSVSATTRGPRSGERDGVDYYFLAEDEFRRRIEQRRFIEHAEVFGHLYGTPVEELETAGREGRLLVLEIDVQGGIQVRQRFAKALMILIVPPSMDELRRRLAGRGTESPEVVQRRFSKASDELAMARESRAYNVEVINADLEATVDKVAALVEEYRRGR